jgi:hypothetical protein
MQLADVPQDQFEAALAEPRIARPRRRSAIKFARR